MKILIKDKKRSFFRTKLESRVYVDGEEKYALHSERPLRFGMGGDPYCLEVRSIETDHSFLHFEPLVGRILRFYSYRVRDANGETVLVIKDIPLFQRLILPNGSAIPMPSFLRRKSPDLGLKVVKFRSMFSNSSAIELEEGGNLKAAVAILCFKRVSDYLGNDG
jgi:hypothetical protein